MAKKKTAKKKNAVLDSKPLKNNPDCIRCGLCDTSETICCPTRGPKGAKLIMFGEALGATEDMEGRAFVGDAGRKLNYTLSNAGLKRKKIAIGNVNRCRPPKNRTPSKKEQEACWPYTLHDILTRKPKAIVALGATAWRALLPHHAKHHLKKWRGFPEQYTFCYTTPKGKLYNHTCWVVAAFHPSACLRNWELDDLLVFDLKLAAAYADGKIVLQTPDTTVHVCESVADVKNLAKHLLRRGSAVVDLESTGTDPHKHKIRCIGFCYRKGEAHIVPMLKKGGLEFWTREEKRQVLRILTRLFLKLKIAGQGLKFDVQMLRKLLGQIDYPIVFDTMCAAHVLDENKPNNLTFLCQWYLHWQKYDAVIARFGDEGDIEGAYTNAPDEILWTYNGYDVDGTFRLWGLFEPLIKAHGVKVPFSIELGLILPLADVEFRGLHVDKKKLIDAAEGYRDALVKTRASLVKTCARVFKKQGVKYYCELAKVEEFNPQEFNPNSADQVAPLMLAAGANLRKKTKGGTKLSTDKLVLGYLALQKNMPGSIARRMRLMRSLTKYKSTYFDGNDEKQDKNAVLGLIAEDDRIHTSYFITAARTGRLSAKNPPLQTVPRVDPASALGYPVSKAVAALVKPRHIYLPDVPGEHVLLEVDYSKAELCVMAWLASDRVMIPELRPGAARELHTNMAITAKLLRDPTDEEYKRMSKDVTKNERAVAKCFHPATEVLTRTGWKKILKLQDGEEVVQAIPGMHGEVVLQWVVPEDVFSMPNEFDHLLHFQNEGIDIKVTPDHGMTVWKGTGMDPWQRVTANEFAKQKFRYWVNAGQLEAGIIKRSSQRVSETMLHLAVATQADGSYSGNRIRFGFTKKRKADRLRELLQELKSSNKNTKWEEVNRVINEKRGWSFSLHAYTSTRIKALLDGKAFPWWWLELSKKLRNAIIDEVTFWDSHKADHWKHYLYTNSDEQSVDVLQTLAAVTGLKAVKKCIGKKKEEHSLLFTLSVKDHGYTRSGDLTCKRIPYTGIVACLTVPSGCVLARRSSRKAKQIPIVTHQSVNFGIPYGRGAKAIAEAGPKSFPLEMPIKRRTEIVQKVVDAWLQKYEDIAFWREEQIDAIRKHGYLRDWLGRRRLLTGIKWYTSPWAEDCLHTEQDNAHMEREAMNFGIQALATGLHNRATRKCYEGIKQVQIPGLRIVMTLHDSLLFNCHHKYVEEATDHIRGWMELTLPKEKSKGRRYEMPLKVDATPCDYWGMGDD